ncbi:hypothetical protein CDAR_39971 [Caerostris darwini]|uniref:Uncharacterized protein n=1 Tax=Caerostris darwini TaxID=1538125 RepID=A0AAV4MKD1_9ARAC|nr:hypothetical protein CDAR_39971 [Caerostris darwini]
MSLNCFIFLIGIDMPKNIIFDLIMSTEHINQELLCLGTVEGVPRLKNIEYASLVVKSNRNFVPVQIASFIQYSPSNKSSSAKDYAGVMSNGSQ